jgi:hypothetical protein
MPSRTAAFSLIAAALAASGTLAASSAAVANASGPGPVSTTICAVFPRLLANLSAAQAIRSVAAGMDKTCGFTISGSFDGAGFGVDGWGLYGTSSYAASGGVHLVWNDQSVIIDFYRTGAGREYLRLYMAPGSGMTAAQGAATLRAQWNAYGVTSNAVIKAAGSSKWIRLTAAQSRKFNANAGVPLTSAALGADIAKGSGRPWRLGGSKTVKGVRFTVLTDPVNNSGPGYLGENLYVNAIGQPTQIKYVSQDTQSVVASFGHWGGVPVEVLPAAPKIVVQP